MGAQDLMHAGFADRVHGAQHVFRAAMQAMARPGTVQTLHDCPAAIGRCHGTIIALLLALCDFETPVWIDPAVASEDLDKFLRFQTGAPLSHLSHDAAFAVVAGPEYIAPLDRFSIGIADYPDRAVTLLVPVDGFTTDMALEGPGIRDSIGFGVAPQSADLPFILGDNHARFPLGADFIFCAPDAIAALPRSTRILDH